ncbi:MAG: acyl carrier protein [Sedimentisphaerales bacterium]|nr:acyl carrier protein [Sedimentisphaerales bacterium]
MQIQEELQNYIIENILFGEQKSIDIDADFQENGILDSIGFLEIITFIEEKYDIRIEDNEVIPENLGTLRNISCFIEKKMNENATA